MPVWKVRVSVQGASTLYGRMGQCQTIRDRFQLAGFSVAELPESTGNLGTVFHVSHHRESQITMFQLMHPASTYTVERLS